MYYSPHQHKHWEIQLNLDLYGMLFAWVYLPWCWSPLRSGRFCRVQGIWACSLSCRSARRCPESEAAKPWRSNKYTITENLKILKEIQWGPKITLQIWKLNKLIWMFHYAHNIICNENKLEKCKTEALSLVVSDIWAPLQCIFFKILS